MQQDTATYQGKEVHAYEFRRSNGMHPERGWVDLAIEDLKEIALEVPAVPWRTTKGHEVGSLTSIDAWWEKFGKSTQTSVPPFEIPPPSKGLKLAGDLVLMTDEDGAKRAIRYSDTYVDGGIEEITDDLDRCQFHDEGKVRVPIVDIRYLYERYGAICERINCMLRSGNPDPATVNKATNKPWTLGQVLHYLFSQLPGSPRIIMDSSTAGLSDPQDLKFEGDPVIEAIEEVLEQAGLEPGMQPDNSWVIRRKGYVKLKKGFIADAVGNTVKPDCLGYEKKTVTVNNRPPLVAVFGKRRAIRITVAYVPIIQNPSDGRYYQLKDIASIFDRYSIDRVNIQRLNGDEKNFEDVPPYIMEEGGDGTLHKARKEALRKWAYKGYAPAFMFERQKLKGAKVETGPISMADSDFETVEMLPMLDVPLYNRERAAILGSSLSDAEKGDVEDYSLQPPIVRASKIGEGHFNDIDEVSSYYKALSKSTKGSLEFLNAWEAETTAKRAHSQEMLERAEDLSKQTISGTGIVNTTFDLLIPLFSLFENPKAQQESIQKIVARITEEHTHRRANYDRLLVEIGEQKRDVTKKLLEWNEEFKEFMKEFTALKTMTLMKVNLPNAVMEQGSYSLDRNTGIVLFTEPACHMGKPFLIHNEGAEVIQDGQVSVTYSYELKGNNVTDFTVPLFAAEDKNENPKVYFVGLSRGSSLAAKVERAPNMRLWMTDAGTPMNLKAVEREARQKAEGQLKIPRVSTGYVYDYSGAVKAVLDGGCNSVHHIFDGDDARTFVFVGAPNSRSGLGPADIGQRPPRTTLGPRNIWNMGSDED